MDMLAGEVEYEDEEVEEDAVVDCCFCSCCFSNFIIQLETIFFDEELIKFKLLLDEE